MKRSIYFLIVICFSFTNPLFAQSDSSLLQSRIPKWAIPVLESNELFQNYTIIDSMNPFYFEADYTGDGVIDIALMVKSNVSGEVGIFIINGGKNICFVMGAGKPIGIGTDISSCDRWFVYRDKYIYNFNARKKKFPIKHPGLEFPKMENRSIIVYWDKRKYKTYISYTP